MDKLPPKSNIPSYTYKMRSKKAGISRCYPVQSKGENAFKCVLPKSQMGRCEQKLCIHGIYVTLGEWEEEKIRAEIFNFIFTLYKLSS